MLRSKAASLKAFMEREIADEGEEVNIVLRDPTRPGSYEVQYHPEEGEPLIITDSRWAEAFLAGFARGREASEANGSASA